MKRRSNESLIEDAAGAARYVALAQLVAAGLIFLTSVVMTLAILQAAAA
jgi:hypothetical protein